MYSIISVYRTRKRADIHLWMSALFLFSKNINQPAPNKGPVIAYNGAERKKNMVERIKELTDRLNEARNAYYSGGNVLMSDMEYDKALEELERLEKETGIHLDNSPVGKVGAFVVTELKKVRHEHPALSLDKVKYKDRTALAKWLGNRLGVMMWKCDGSTVVLTYDNGELTSAVTRGNGEEGSEITHNARFFKGVPTKIGYTGHLVVRGEAMMTNAEFERVNTEAGGIYENARNLATATIQMLDARESRKREIIFKAFELVVPGTDVYIGDDTRSSLDVDYNLRFMEDRLDWLEKLGFDVVDHEYADPDILDKIEKWKEDVQNLPYPTDGLVFSYNDLEEGWALGSTGHHPRWAMALKWTDETAETTIRDIEWSVGKTGIITPVAIFDTVRLGLGSNVSRASLHNLSIMKKMPKIGGGTCMCGKGSKARVYLANMIIPQVSECTDLNPELYREDELFVKPYIADRCPVCGTETKIAVNNGVEVLVCPNHDGCPAQQVGKLMNTFGKDGLFVKGLGEKQIQDLIEYGIVDASPLSFYSIASRWKDFSANPYKNLSEPGYLAIQDLIKKDGWGKKKWENLIDAINASRNTTLQKFLYSLNIPLLGNDLSKKLSKEWGGKIGDFLNFYRNCDTLPFETLSDIEGIGPEKAGNIFSWCQETLHDQEKNAAFLGMVEELDFEEPAESEGGNTLSGLTFVITGAVHDYKNRDEFKASVEARGGKVAGSVSAKTSFLVANDKDSGTGKAAKAAQLGVPVLTEDEFIERFGR